LKSFFKEYKQEEADKAFQLPRYKKFYDLIEQTTNSHDTMKTISDHLGVDYKLVFKMLEYSFPDMQSGLNRLLRKQYNEALGSNIESLLIPKISEEMSDIYITLSMLISLRTMFGCPIKEQVSNFLESLTFNHNLLQNLWKDYKALGTQTPPKLYKNFQSKFYEFKMKQQVWILLCIFKGIQTDLFQINHQLFLDMFKTFVDQKLSGSMEHDLAEMGDSPVGMDFEQNIDSIRHLSCLILIASLKLSNLFRLSPDVVISNDNKSYSIIKECSESVIDTIISPTTDSSLILSMGHFIVAYNTAMDCIALLIDRFKKTSEESFKKKLQQMYTRFDFVTSYEQPIKELLDSKIYAFLTGHEKELIKKCLKDFFTLYILPKQETINIIEEMEESDCDFITKTLCKILDSPSELEEFWANVIDGRKYLSNIAVVFTNFLSIFPIKSELTLNLAAKLLGNSEYSFVEQVIDVFANMRSYTLAEDPDDGNQRLEFVRLENINRFERDNENGYKCILTRPFVIPNSHGLEIPVETKFLSTAKGNLQFEFNYNYWNVFWRAMTSVLCESRNGINSLSVQLQRMIKLVCRMIALNPLCATQLQQIMLTPNKGGQVVVPNDPNEGGCSALVCVLLYTLAMLRDNPDCISLALDIMRALNNLLRSQLCPQVVLTIQLFENIYIDNSFNRHVIPSLIELFYKKYYGSKPKPAELLEQITAFIEVILLKSDYLYQYFPVQEYVQSKSQSQISIDQSLADALARKHAQLNNSSYWDEKASNELNDMYLEFVKRKLANPALITSRILPEMINSILPEIMDITNNNNSVEFESCLELKFQIRARVVSIFTNLLERFHTNGGSKLNPGKLGMASYSLSQDSIAEFLNKINLFNYIFYALDTEVIQSDVFLGKKEATSDFNPLGIENKIFSSEVSFSQHKNRAAQSFQTLIIETLKCISESSKLSIEYMKNSTAASSKLAYIREFVARTTNPEDFYDNKLSNFAEEYSISFVVTILILISINKEKSIKSMETHKIHSLELVFVNLISKNLFCPDTIINFKYCFASMINQFLAYGSGRNGFIPRNTCITSAAFEALTEILKVWRKGNKPNKPVLTDILTTGKLPSNFSNQVLTYIHNNILECLTNIDTNPCDTYQALRFLSETLVSQLTFFSDFIKYCDNVREVIPKVNALVRSLEDIVKFLEIMPIGELFDKGYYFECLCQIVQLVSNMYLRANVRKEIIGHLRQYVLGRLAKLLLKVLEERKSFLSNVLEHAQSLFYSSSHGFKNLESVHLAYSIDILRIRFVLDQECNFCFSLSVFMKVLNGELLDKNRVESSNESNSIPPNIFLKLLNYTTDQKRLKIYPFLELLENNVKNVMLNPDSPDQVSLSQIGIWREAELPVQFLEIPALDPTQLKDWFYDDTWGYQYDERDIETKIRENNHGFEYVNSTLYYLNLYNQLNRLALYGRVLASEVNKNLSFVIGNGFNGQIFSTSLHQNPMYPTQSFLRNLTRMLIESDPQRAPNFEWSEELVKAAQGLEDISSTEQRLYGPLGDVKHEEWLGSLYGYNGKFADEFNVFRALVDNCIDELNQLSDLAKELKKDYNISRQEILPGSALWYLLGQVSEVALNHLAALGHLITNMYFGLQLKSSNERDELIEISRRIVQTVGYFLSALHGQNGLGTDTAATSQTMKIRDNILLATHYCLFILSQFPAELPTLNAQFSLAGAAKMLQHTLRVIPERSFVAIQSFALLIKIREEFVAESDIEDMLRLLQDINVDDNTYRSICQLLIVAVDTPQMLKRLSAAKILSAISSTKRFIGRESFNQFIYYQGEQKDNEFCSWLWTLALAHHTYEAFKKINGANDALISFIKTYIVRIISVLGFQLAAIGRTYINWEDEKLRSESFKTTAYLEELELTLAIVSSLFTESPRWVNQHRMVFDNLIYTMLTRTLLLFDNSLSLNEQFVPVSWTEKLSRHFRALNNPNEKDLSLLDVTIT
jgi:hypothetical protein